MFASNITTTSTTVTGLTPGVVYYFYVRARNIVGLSGPSSTIPQLAAQVPNSPTGLADVKTITNAYQIGLTWTAPTFNGGSALIDYRIWYDNGFSGSIYWVVATNITTTSYTVTDL